MEKSYDYVQENDSSKTTITYNCEVEDLKYTKIGDNIKADFDFLIKDIPDYLDNALKSLDKAAQIKDAFYFENSSKLNDLMKIYDEIKFDVSSAKTYLYNLHSALITDIDNVNAELETNFGYLVFGSAKEAGRVVEEKSTQ